MPPIRKSTEVDAPVDEVRLAWPRFVAWGLVGPRRLTCGELACVNAVEVGTVAFRSNGEATTTVVFELDLSDADREVAEDQLGQDMWHDLLLFKEYVEDHSSAGRRGSHEDEQRSLRGSESMQMPNTERPDARA